MSIAELKCEVDRLTPEEKEELMAYLGMKSRRLDPETRRKLTEKINDKNPARWLTLEEVEKKLGDQVA
jgi:hypothetical protein